MKKSCCIYAAISVFMAGCMLAHTAEATSQQDLSVALKTLPLLTNKLANPASIAIVYNPAQPPSKTDADNIKSIFDDGLKAPNDISISAHIITVNELSNSPHPQIIFLTQNLSQTDYATVSTTAAGTGILTIGADLACVKDNKCVLGVTSAPQVNVYYSPIAAEKAKVSFAAAFVMLAKQVGDHP